MSDTLEGMERIYQEALDLARRKNHDYGDAWRSNGWRGNLSRIFEKDQRLRTLLWNGNAPEARVTDEDVRQTAVDMLNTLTFFIMNLEAGVEWGHEMPFHHIGAKFEPEGFAGGQWVSPAEARDKIFERVHESLAGTEPTGVIPAIDQNVSGPYSGELPVRDPGVLFRASPEAEENTTAQNDLLVQKDTTPSPVRRQPKRP